MKIKYKLLILDVDGVLVFKNNFIPEKTYLSNLIDEGMLITIATGRSLISAKNIVSQLGIKIPFISFNGSLIYDPVSNEILYQKILSKLDLNQIISVANDFDIKPIFFTSSNVIATEENSILENYCNNQNINFQIDSLESLNNRELIKILFISDNKSLSSFRHKIKNIIGFNHFFFTRKNYLELVSKSSSKFKATERLSSLTNIRLSQILAIGDQETDLEMLCRVGKGYCMPNSPAYVKEKVGLVAPKSDNVIENIVNENLC